MSELLKLVLVDKTARGTNASKVAAANATDKFAPWADAVEQ